MWFMTLFTYVPCLLFVLQSPVFLLQVMVSINLLILFLSCWFSKLSSLFFFLIFNFWFISAWFLWRHWVLCRRLVFTEIYMDRFAYWKQFMVLHQPGKFTTLPFCSLYLLFGQVLYCSLYNYNFCSFYYLVYGLYACLLWFHDNHHRVLSRMWHWKFNFPEVVRTRPPCKQDEVTIVALYWYIPSWELLWASTASLISL